MKNSDEPNKIAELAFYKWEVKRSLEANWTLLVNEIITEKQHAKIEKKILSYQNKTGVVFSEKELAKLESDNYICYGVYSHSI